MVARRLRELRKRAGLTVTELAERCGWHHAKTSRVENARTAPSAQDIRAWCRVCEAADQADDIVAQSLNAESMYREWRRQVRGGLKKLQDSVVDFYRQTQLFRVYSSTLVPGMLQTEGYAASVLGYFAKPWGMTAEDVAEAAAARVARSRIIHEPGHRFVLLIEESVLRYRVAEPDVMAGQLGYLMTAGSLPAVSLGIIPMATPRRAQWPHETFHIHDDTMVAVETISAAVNITQPSEIALYLKAFEDLRSMAVYGAAARALIVRSIEALGRFSPTWRLSSVGGQGWLIRSRRYAMPLDNSTPGDGNVTSERTEWRHQMQNGLKPLQESLVELFGRTRLFRIYSSTLVPGLLQTEGYAAAVLNAVAEFRELPVKDVAEAAAARVKRSGVIHEPGHRFELLVEEAVLRCRIGDREVMAGQLDRLLTAGSSPAMSFGVIPMATPRQTQWPRETFHVYDDALVSVEAISAQVSITQPHEIALYLKAFDQLREMAVYGAEARALVEKAAEALG